MNREQMVKRMYDAIQAAPWTSSDMEDAAAYLDAVLPQVTTVAELRALPHNAVVMAPRSGVCMREWEAIENGWPGSPALTVVWQPEVTA